MQNRSTLPKVMKRTIINDKYAFIKYTNKINNSLINIFNTENKYSSMNLHVPRTNSCINFDHYTILQLNYFSVQKTQ